MPVELIAGGQSKAQLLTIEPCLLGNFWVGGGRCACRGQSPCKVFFFLDGGRDGGQSATSAKEDFLRISDRELIDIEVFAVNPV